MTLNDTLKAIGQGARAPMLLHNARLEAGGAVLFGEEMVLAHFRRHPLALEGARILASDTGFAVFGADDALVADLYDGHVGRMWRLGKDCGETVEPAVSVAFDPDLTQARGDVFARAEDHPGVDAAALAALLDAARELIADPAPFRTRAWLVRALADGDAAAGLFAVHRLGDEAGGRSAVLAYAAVLAEGGGHRIVRDLAGEAAVRAAGWTPRLVA